MVPSKQGSNVLLGKYRMQICALFIIIIYSYYMASNSQAKWSTLIGVVLAQDFIVPTITMETVCFHSFSLPREIQVEANTKGF